MTLIESSPKKLYIRVEAQPVTTAGIYHSPEQWLISLSSDWSTWITIADKNLWATQVYNDGDTLDEANCWKFYQRWNIYWFPYNWTFSSTTTRTDAGNYWPWNYYSSSTFIYRSSSPFNWDTSGNGDLWWWTTGTNEAMQWPCDSWFHIPTSTELSNITTIMSSLWLTLNWNTLKTYLLLPLAWQISYNTWWYNNKWTIWVLWASNAYSATDWYRMSFDSSDIYHGSIYKTNWQNIRPFANTPVQPDDSRTVLYPTN